MADRDRAAGIRAVSCPACQAPSGDSCVTASGRPASRPHRARVHLAAHSDPALDEHWPHRGPCLLCGTPGLGARHRVIDSVAGWLEASAEDLADDPAALDGELAAEFGVTAEALAAVREWMLRHPGAWR